MLIPCTTNITLKSTDTDGKWAANWTAIILENRTKHVWLNIFGGKRKRQNGKNCPKGRVSVKVSEQ